MLDQMLFSKIREGQNILLAGAGGGFDIFCGLPLYFSLRAQGKSVHLANLSFSQLPEGDASTPAALRKLTYATPQEHRYCPELLLARWFKEHEDSDIPIYVFPQTGVKPLKEAYQYLVKTLDIDTVILIDGGTDSLMRGDESGLGTPHEDVASILAVRDLPVSRKILACLGFGIDAFHGVCHADFLEAVARLIQTDGYLGILGLQKEMPEYWKYKAACRYVFSSMPQNVSIVSSSIISAVDGKFGNHHATGRTETSELFINPLMSIYWFFDLVKVAEQILYAEHIVETETYADVGFEIAVFRGKLEKIKDFRELPM